MDDAVGILRNLPLEMFEAPQPNDAWARCPLATLSDGTLVQTVAAAIARPKIQIESSFLLHAPLELLARAWHLRHLSPDKREAARRRIAEIAVRYAGNGPEIESRPKEYSDTVQALSEACALCEEDPAMQSRLNAPKASPAGYQAMLGLESFVRKSSGLEASLLELIKMRASQINGCAYCIDMHSKDARAHGETEQRLYALDAWRETPFFTERERAALEWTESVTRVSEGHVADAIYGRVKNHFTEEELVNLTLAVVTINGWNRLAIAFRMVPGEYRASDPRGESGGE